MVLPGLVNIQKAMENHYVCLMGKSAISMAIFNSKLLVYQRVPGFFREIRNETRGAAGASTANSGYERCRGISVDDSWMNQIAWLIAGDYPLVI